MSDDKYNLSLDLQQCTWIRFAIIDFISKKGAIDKPHIQEFGRQLLDDIEKQMRCQIKKRQESNNA